MNFNVNCNVLQSKYIVHPLVKIKKVFDNVKTCECVDRVVLNLQNI